MKTSLLILCWISSYVTAILIEGDITEISPFFNQNEEEDTGHRNIINVNNPHGKSALWPNGKVPVNLESIKKNPEKFKFVEEAIRHIEEHSCIRIEEMTSNKPTDFITFSDAGNSAASASAVGRIGGEQSIRLGSLSTKSVAVHEILHSLGIKVLTSVDFHNNNSFRIFS